MEKSYITQGYDYDMTQSQSKFDRLQCNQIIKNISEIYNTAILTLFRISFEVFT